MIVSAFVILFIAGYPLKFFAFIGVAGIGAFVALIAAAPYRLDRIKSYIDPWNDPLGIGFPRNTVVICDCSRWIVRSWIWQ